MDKDETIVLVIEDSDSSFRVTQLLFDDEEIASKRCRIKRAETLTHAMELIQTTHIDVIILDLKLPDSQGMNTFEAIKTVAGEIPIIILTVEEDDIDAMTYINKGAKRFITKGSVCNKALVRITRLVVEIAKDVKKV